MAQRIFTIAGRNGVVVCTDSKRNESNQGTYETYKGEDTKLQSLIALNNVLKRVPRNVKFETPVTFLLPKSISFLNYEDTRTFWLTNKKSKSGNAVSPEMLEQVQIMHQYLSELGDSVRLFGQQGIKSAVFNSYIRSTWHLMDTLVKPEEKVDPAKSW